MKNLLQKFKKPLVNFVKGIAIGIAMIVPGVSGGTLALILGIYSDLIDSVNGLFKHFGKSIKTLLPIILGALVGFLALVTPIKYGLENCPLVVITLFVGLIIGGIPSLYKKVKGHESIKGFALSFVAIAFMVGICFLVSSITVDISTLTFGLWMYLFLTGILIAAALVMPGISGSMLLMVLGLYSSILFVIKDLMGFNNIFNNLMIVLPIGLGALIGFFAISFIMGKLLKKCEIGTYFVIIGLVIGSIGSIYYLSFQEYTIVFDALNIILSIVGFIFGFLLTFLIERFVSKNKIEEKKEEVDETR